MRTVGLLVALTIAAMVAGCSSDDTADQPDPPGGDRTSTTAADRPGY